MFGRLGRILRIVRCARPRRIRRNEVCIAEIELGGLCIGLVEADRALVLVDDIDLILGLLTRDRVLLSQFLVTFEIYAILVEHGLIARELAAILIERCLIGARVNLGAHLSRAHLGIVITINILNDAGDVGADNNSQHRIDGPRGGRSTGDGAVLDWDG